MAGVHHRGRPEALEPDARIAAGDTLATARLSLPAAVRLQNGTIEWSTAPDRWGEGPSAFGVLARFLRLRAASDDEIAAFCRTHGPLFVLDSGRIGLRSGEFPPFGHDDERLWHREDAAAWRKWATTALATLAVGRTLRGDRSIELARVLQEAGIPEPPRRLDIALGADDTAWWYGEPRSGSLLDHQRVRFAHHVQVTWIEPATMAPAFVWTGPVARLDLAVSAPPFLTNAYPAAPLFSVVAAQLVANLTAPDLRLCRRCRTPFALTDDVPDGTIRHRTYCSDDCARLARNASNCDTNRRSRAAKKLKGAVVAT